MTESMMGVSIRLRTETKQSGPTHKKVVAKTGEESKPKKTDGHVSPKNVATVVGAPLFGLFGCGSDYSVFAYPFDSTLVDKLEANSVLNHNPDGTVTSSFLLGELNGKVQFFIYQWPHVLINSSGALEINTNTRVDDNGDMEVVDDSASCNNYTTINCNPLASSNVDIPSSSALYSGAPAANKDVSPIFWRKVAGKSEMEYAIGAQLQTFDPQDVSEKGQFSGFPVYEYNGDYVIHAFDTSGTLKWYEVDDSGELIYVNGKRQIRTDVEEDKATLVKALYPTTDETGNVYSSYHLYKTANGQVFKISDYPSSDPQFSENGELYGLKKEGSTCPASALYDYDSYEKGTNSCLASHSSLITDNKIKYDLRTTVNIEVVNYSNRSNPKVLATQSVKPSTTKADAENATPVIFDLDALYDSAKDQDIDDSDLMVRVTFVTEGIPVLEGQTETILPMIFPFGIEYKPV